MQLPATSKKHLKKINKLMVRRLEIFETRFMWSLDMYLEHLLLINYAFERQENIFFVLHKPEIFVSP